MTNVKKTLQTRVNLLEKKLREEEQTRPKKKISRLERLVRKYDKAVEDLVKENKKLKERLSLPTN